MRYYSASRRINMTSSQGISLEAGGMARGARHTARFPDKNVDCHFEFQDQENCSPL